MLKKFIDMMPFKDTLQNTLRWFELAVPSPDRQNFNTQLGVHVEEFNEMLETLSPQTVAGKQLLIKTIFHVEKLAHFLKNNPNAVVVTVDQRMDFLDSLCDQIVTATGTGYMQGLDVPAALAEQVNPSNFSKFDQQTGEPIFNENKKVMKGPAYIKADLSSYV